ncbi:MAG: hypothetical protein GQ544_01725 [Candidatus Aminicenantes bacterium]|nr:hypothetical protein [Candidatus Aminicenantes bacterium]
MEFIARMLILNGLVLFLNVSAQTRQIEKYALRNEPFYKSGNPQYFFSAIGPKSKVWVVQDGENAYVDRNSNGDITETDKIVVA